jgi:hypothetical protein
MASVVDPLQGAAKILEILERILPKCIDYCKNMKLYPNDRKIILDLKVVEQEIGCLDDEQKRLYPERLAGIERACKRYVHVHVLPFFDTIAFSDLLQSRRCPECIVPHGSTKFLAEME